MDNYSATEQAYKNGYEKGRQDALKWIPVSEMPKKDGKYLAHKNLWGTSVISTLYFAQKGETVCAYDLKGQKEVWYDYDSECGYFPVKSITHWMHLPQPPKGE